MSEYHEQAKLIFKQASIELALVGELYLDIMAAIYVIMKLLNEAPAKQPTSMAITILRISIDTAWSNRLCDKPLSINECAQESCAILRSYNDSTK